MNILLANTHHQQGGAALAARRLHEALRRAGGGGVRSWHLVRGRDGREKDVLEAMPRSWSREAEEHQQAYHRLQDQVVGLRRTQLSNTLFTPACHAGYDLSSGPAAWADVVNLHWVAQWQTPASLARLLDSGTPVVWTLHDMWPFTGGCHYSSGCRGFQDDCAACPQLSPEPCLGVSPQDLPRAVLADKLELWDRSALTVVTPSAWLAGQARASALFSDCRVEVIHNGLDTEFYSPGDRRQARRHLGLPEEAAVVLFGAGDLDEARKGGVHLSRALRALADACSGRTRPLVAAGFGRIGPETARSLEPCGPDLHFAGLLHDPQEVVRYMRAADVFLLPSLEDNLPNTMLEALSCGLPVAAFAAGGVPEAVEQGRNGLLVPAGDGPGLGEAVAGLLASPGTLAAMSRAARRTALERFDSPIMARKYLRLFRDLAGQGDGRLRPDPRGRDDSCPMDLLLECGPRTDILLKCLKKPYSGPDRPGGASDGQRPEDRS